MDNRQPSRLRSTAAIDGHPFHPLLVTLPIAFLIGALLTDLAFQGTGDAFWARASTWLFGAGLVSGALAAVARGGNGRRAIFRRGAPPIERE